MSPKVIPYPAKNENPQIALHPIPATGQKTNFDTQETLMKS
jgi:hypothetical protein